MEKSWKQLLENEKIKKLFRKENLVVFILCGILLMVIVWPTDKKTSQDRMLQENSQGEITDVTNISTETFDYETYGVYLESRLQEILSTMNGVGQVSVMLTFYSTDEKVILKDEESIVSEELGELTQSNQTNRNETTVCYVDETGAELPFQTSMRYPKVEGVVVVAEGANDPEVVMQITEIVQALFDLEIHKIRVVTMKSE